RMRRAASANASGAVKSAGGHGATRSGGRTRRILVGAELALALTLLTGAGLMLRSFVALLRTEAGFDTDHVGTIELTFARAVGPEENRRLRVIRETLDRVRAMPGVEAAGAVNDLPIRRDGGGVSMKVDAEGGGSAKIDQPFVRYLMASDGYFHALGIPLLRGRLMAPTDNATAPPVAVISERMAKTFWPGQDPIGKRFKIGSAESQPKIVIGVVGDVREGSLEREARMQMYFPVDSWTPTAAALVVRGSVPEAVLLNYLTSALREVDPAQAFYNARSMDELLRHTLAPRRSNTALVTVFGILALVLAVVGVYGVMAYGVALRSRELGIRAALGAGRRRLVGLVLGESLTTATIGIGVGLAGTLALSKVIRSMLYGVAPTDPAVLLGAALTLLGAIAVAAVVPARRAARTDPAVTLREE
ncbi:MAG: FtsX-like permease family protein, partial [Gemmatimonadales bacterium]|nr:FtsX-like permease family protein [Gemmatimonadales bacterium]